MHYLLAHFALSAQLLLQTLDRSGNLFLKQPIMNTEISDQNAQVHLRFKYSFHFDKNEKHT